MWAILLVVASIIVILLNWIFREQLSKSLKKVKSCIPFLPEDKIVVDILNSDSPKRLLENTSLQNVLRNFLPKGMHGKRNFALYDSEEIITEDNLFQNDFNQPNPMHISSFKQKDSQKFYTSDAFTNLNSSSNEVNVYTSNFDITNSMILELPTICSSTNSSTISFSSFEEKCKGLQTSSDCLPSFSSLILPNMNYNSKSKRENEEDSIPCCIISVNSGVKGNYEPASNETSINDSSASEKTVSQSNLSTNDFKINNQGSIAYEMHLQDSTSSFEACINDIEYKHLSSNNSFLFDRSESNYSILQGDSNSESVDYNSLDQMDKNSTKSLISLASHLEDNYFSNCSDILTTPLLPANQQGDHLGLKLDINTAA